jgi:hypothetical protein
MEFVILIGILIPAFGLYRWGYNSRDQEVQRLESSLKTVFAKHAEAEASVSTLEQTIRAREADLISRAESISRQLKETQKRLGEARAESKRVYEAGLAQIERLRADSALLPSLVFWADQLRERMDSSLAAHVATEFRAAPKADERVREASSRARLAERERDALRNRVALYESQAPWLVELEDLSLDQLLAALREQAALDTAVEDGIDPVRILITPIEYAGLSGTERNQLALDRFEDRTRARTAWAAGLEYERFIGYTLEREGWSVEYHGAQKGLADLGLDLICKRDGLLLAVQCKRLSPAREIPVRENVVAQIFGASRYLAHLHGIDVASVTPLVVTSFVLSDEARRFAAALGVQITENLRVSAYPRIKCNISRKSGERIYHLPFDQQYDSTVVDEKAGELYVAKVAEAERLGFRRAFRWSGQ